MLGNRNGIRFAAIPALAVPKKIHFWRIQFNQEQLQKNWQNWRVLVVVVAIASAAGDFA